MAERKRGLAAADDAERLQSELAESQQAAASTERTLQAVRRPSPSRLAGDGRACCAPQAGPPALPPGSCRWAGAHARRTRRVPGRRRRKRRSRCDGGGTHDLKQAGLADQGRQGERARARAQVGTQALNMRQAMRDMKEQTAELARSAAAAAAAAAAQRADADAALAEARSALAAERGRVAGLQARGPVGAGRCRPIERGVYKMWQAERLVPQHHAALLDS